jgi:hypothetical protein
VGAPAVLEHRVMLTPDAPWKGKTRFGHQSATCAIVLGTFGGCDDNPTPGRGEPAAAPQPGQSTATLAAVPESPGASRQALAAPVSSALPSEQTLNKLQMTSGITHVKREAVGHGLRVQRALRVAAHDGYERVVLAFDEAVPGYHLEYIDRPIRDCGRGEVVEVAGEGWLEVRLFPAAAHTEAGQPTIFQRALQPRLDVVREVERTCDFEGVVSWVIGTATPNRYRVFELSNPPRLVIDIASP